MNAHEVDLTTLLDRIERGETDLYLQVVRRFELPLRSYLAGQLYNITEADDLAQEVFITAWRDLGSFRRSGDFGAWLRKGRSSSRASDAIPHRPAVAEGLRTSEL